ncbi:MAG: PAS domain S-box protein [Haloarculaceae archaeon]
MDSLLTVVGDEAPEPVAVGPHGAGDDHPPTSYRRTTSEDIVEAVRADRPDCVVLADDLSPAAVESVVTRVHEAAPGLPVVAFASEDDAVATAAARAGATAVLRRRLREVADCEPGGLVRVVDAVAGEVGTEPVPDAAGSDVPGDGRFLPADDGAPASLGDALDRYETILNAVGDGIYLLDANGRFVAVNDAVEERTGYDRDELLGEPASKLVGEASAAEAAEAIRDLLREDESRVVTLRQTVETADDERFPCENRMAVLVSDGQFRGSVGVVRDVSERIERERELRRQTALVEGIFDAVPDLLYTFDERGRLIRWNDSATAVTGYTDEELADMRVLEFIPPEDRERVLGAITRGVTDMSVRRVESAIVTKDGERIPYEFTGGPVVDDDGELIGLAGVGRDVSDRLEREAKIERQRDELDALNRINAVIRDIDQALIDATDREAAEQAVCDRLADAPAYQYATIGAFDGDGEFRPRVGAGDAPVDVGNVTTLDGSPGAAAARTGSVSAVRHIGSATWFEGGDDGGVGVQSMAAVPITADDGDYGLLVVCSDRPDAFDEREQAVLDELGETIGHAVAAVEREERERILTALQDSTRGLIGADSPTAVSERVVAAVADALADVGVGVYLFEAASGRLEAAAATEDAPALAGDDWPAAIDDADSTVWRHFVDGQATTFGAELADPVVDLAAGSAMVVPLGDHGVFVAVSDDADAFDEGLRRVLDLFAATTEAALDRVEGEANLRERDAALEARNRRLRRQVQLNEVLRNVDDALVAAATREEIESSVPERLVSEDLFAFAWIGTDDGTDVSPAAWAGTGQDYLDSVPHDAEGEAAEPAARALAEGRPVVVSDVADSLHAAAWRQEAIMRGFRSVIAVPLAYENYTYGVLTVYASEPGAFSDLERQVFRELGVTIANAINAVETKQAIVADEVVRLKLEVTDDSCPLVGLATATNCRVELDGVTAWTSETLRAFVTVSEADLDAVERYLADSLTIERAHRVGVTDGGASYELVFSGPTVLGTLLKHGGSPQQLVVADGRLSVVVDVPRDIRVRKLVEAMRSTFPSTELTARRDVTRSLQTQREVREEVLDAMTERQREVLTTAFLAGYFEWPRESSGQEVADMLGISQPAVNRHLRLSQGAVLEWLLATESDDAASLPDP